MRATLIVGLLATTVTQFQLAYATIYVAEWTSCLKHYSPVAPENEQLKAEHVYAEIVPSQDTAARNLVDDHDTLRLDVIGTLGSKMNGYNESNNRVGELSPWVCVNIPSLDRQCNPHHPQFASSVSN